MRVIGARTPSNDRGATAVIVSLCLVALFMIAAWVIDGGALYQEKAELQRGADAAALAIARDCALGDCGAYNTTAQTYVDANAGDGASTIPLGGVTFPGTNQVRVEVATFDAGNNVDGDTATVDYTFATLAGRSGFQVEAAAVAAWGPPSGGSTLPLIMSMCEFNRETDDGAAFVPPPFTSGTPAVVYFHTGNGNGNGNGNGPDDCAAQAGHDTDGDDRMPGGFGWLQQDSCFAEVSDDLWVGGKPGAGAPRDCDPDDLLNQTVLLPVYNDVAERGPGWQSQCTLGPGGRCYRIEGFAAFHITGFRFPGGSSWAQNAPCNAPDTCMSGYFTEAIFPGGGSGGGTAPNLGALTIWLES